jgi:cytochrome c peroxidase/cytochrome c553
MILRKQTLVVWAVPLILVAILVATSDSQEPNLPKEGRSGIVHLVGHEEQGLLNRIQDVIDDYDPRRLNNPYLRTIVTAYKDGEPVTKLAVRRPDLLEFIADPEAAVALGKAFFWEMRAGSDFRRIAKPDGKMMYVGTACASCHYQHGADTRQNHTARIPYVAWDKYPLHPQHPADDFVQRPMPLNLSQAGAVTLKPHIIGSQGVEPYRFDGLEMNPPTDGNWLSEKSKPRALPEPLNHIEKMAKHRLVWPEWSMFVEGQQAGGKYTRQITSRNSPTVVNAVFADRLFHDARAESTFNGVSIFGDHDKRHILFKADKTGAVLPVHVAISNAALASQAVGPIVNEVEMSYLGRTFHDLAEKLLAAQPLSQQTIHKDDIVFGPMLIGGKLDTTYEKLIEKAFRAEWWQSPAQVELRLSEKTGGKYPTGSLKKANFSLYWGLALLMYQSTLISNQSPFDAMMQGNGKPADKLWESEGAQHLKPIFDDRYVTPAQPNGTLAQPKPELKSGSAVFQFGQRVFHKHHCAECHDGPLQSEIFDRARNREAKPTIAKTLERTLVPNAQADALAIRLAGYREQTRDAVVAVLLSIQPNLKPAATRNHFRDLAWRLQQSSGNINTLDEYVNQYLTKVDNDIWHSGTTSDVLKTKSTAIAKALMTFERSQSTSVGGRPFFTEQERVKLAESLTQDVPILVEKMLFDRDQFLNRPKLPIQGPYTTELYAFYDGGVYQIGVTWPRFDRGIGGMRTDTAFSDEQIKTSLSAQTTIVNRAVIQTSKNTPESDSNKSVKYLEEKLNKTKAVLTDPEDIKNLKKLDDQNRAKAQSRQSASGAGGSAYTPSNPGKSSGTEEQRIVDTPNDPFDISWHRNEFVTDPNDPLVTDITHRRSHSHFLSRARRLVMDEENWGHRKPFIHDNELAFWGAFKTPTLRNVSLTKPYMHNGQLKTLSDVIKFYNAGGMIERSLDKNPDLHPLMKPLGMTDDERKALEFYLLCLTDPRVREHKGPFNRPGLVVVDGYTMVGDKLGEEKLTEISGTGGKN